MSSYLPACWPVFWFEQRRSYFGRIRRARGRLHYAVQAMIPLGILLLLCIWSNARTIANSDFAFFWHNTCWHLILGGQLWLTLALAPVLAARSITRERKQGTLDLLLMTPVPSYSLTVQKLCSVLVHFLPVPLLTLLITPLLVIYKEISLIEFVLAYLVLFMQMASIAAIGLYCSCRSTSIWGVLLWSYFFGICSICLIDGAQSHYASIVQIFISQADFPFPVFTPPNAAPYIAATEVHRLCAYLLLSLLFILLITIALNVMRGRRGYMLISP